MLEDEIAFPSDPAGQVLPKDLWRHFKTFEQEFKFCSDTKTYQ